MVEIYNGPSGFIHASASSLSSDAENSDPELLKDKLSKFTSQLDQLKLSDQVEIKIHSKKGLCLFTRKDFKIGSVVFQESPKLVYTTHGFCPFCRYLHKELVASDKRAEFEEVTDQEFLAQVERGIRKICKKGEEFRKAIMPFIRFLDIDDGVFNTIEVRKIRLVILFLFLFDADWSNKRTSSFFTDKSETSEDEAKNLNENLEDEQRALSRIFDLKMEVSCESLKTEEIRYTASEVLREILKIKKVKKLTIEEISEIFSVVNSNAFEITVSHHFTGSALYLVTSLINHSCNPNCYFSFDPDDFSIEIVAKRDMEAGEELTISYDNFAEIMNDTTQRILYISQNLGFVCKCDKCIS